MFLYNENHAMRVDIYWTEPASHLYAQILSWAMPKPSTTEEDLLAIFFAMQNVFHNKSCITKPIVDFYQKEHPKATPTIPAKYKGITLFLSQVKPAVASITNPLRASAAM